MESTTSWIVVVICLIDALAVGGTAAVQAGVNATAGEALGHEMYGILTSFTGANLILLIMNISAMVYRVYYAPSESSP